MSWRRALNPLLKPLGLYTSYTLGRKEFVGHLPENGRQMLKRAGYEPLPTVAGIELAAAKKHPETGDTHAWSLRRIDPANIRKQYHVHAWAVWGGWEIASHHEFRPDPYRIDGETWRAMVSRLRTHYRPELGTDYVKGAMCDELKALL